MEEQSKEQLVERFRSYLETDIHQNDEEVFKDDYSLFSEISGLKSEVRIESRQFKSALGDFRDAFSVVDGANHDLTEKLLHLQSQQGEEKKLVLQPLVSGLMDLYDRLQAGLERESPRQNVFQMLFGGRKQKRWFRAHREGQEMTLSRVLDLLVLCDVMPMDVTHIPFDPGTMRAVQFETDSERPNSLVLKECRKGFMQGTQVIRPTEVIVNKIEE